MHYFRYPQVLILILFLPTLSLFLFWVNLLVPQPVDPWRPRLLDIKRYNFIHQNATMCNSQESDPKTKINNHLLMIIIHSARHHFAYRDAIRETWGSLNEHGNWTIRKAFILGSASQHQNNDSKAAETQLIESES